MKKYIIVTLSALIIMSCSKDLLEKAPIDTLNPSIFWQSQEDAIAAVNNLYSHLPVIRTTLYREIMTDFAIGSSGDEGRNNVLEGTTDASSGIYHNYWRNYYTRIAATNYFLDNVDKVQDINETLLRRIKAEARFIRAYAYLELTMDFGDVPLITETITVSQGASIERTNRFEVFDFIILEMEQIVSDLQNRSQQHADRSEIGRATSGAALALKARAAIYAGSLAQNFGGAEPDQYFSKTVEASQQIVSSGQYELYPDFSELFSYEAQYSNEVIMSRIYTKDFIPHSTFQNNAPQALTGRPIIDLSITRAIVDLFQMKDTGKSIDADGSGFIPQSPYWGRDPRLEATVFLPAYNDTSYSSIIDGKRWDPRPGLPASIRVSDVLSQQGGATKSGFALRKYINPEEDRGQGANDGVNLILIRYADVLLMYAEALIELNQNLGIAVDLINQVRQRAEMPTLANSGFSATDLSSQSALREIVRRERKVELALEGHRLYDIRRWKIAENLIDGPIEGMTYEDYATKEITTFVWTTRVRIFTPSRDYLFPVPMGERDINPALTQNPGW
jgi:starch-binding outer membrane protein, SusD/RagB family